MFYLFKNDNFHWIWIYKDKGCFWLCVILQIYDKTVSPFFFTWTAFKMTVIGRLVVAEVQWNKSKISYKESRALYSMFLGIVLFSSFDFLEFDIYAISLPLENVFCLFFHDLLVIIEFKVKGHSRSCICQWSTGNVNCSYTFSRILWKLIVIYHVFLCSSNTDLQSCGCFQDEGSSQQPSKVN